MVEKAQLIFNVGMLVTFCLLTSVATAHAECVWVLSQQHVAIDGQGNIKLPVEPLYGRYSILRTFPNQSACEKAEAAASTTKPQFRDVLFCLPDTVAPRGPKAKLTIHAPVLPGAPTLRRCDTSRTRSVAWSQALHPLAAEDDARRRGVGNPLSFPEPRGAPGVGFAMA